jgi:hypothetical protein
MKGVVILLVVLALVVGGWYFATHRTGDWVVTVSNGGGQTIACFKMNNTTLTRDIFNGTISWHVGGQQLNFPASVVHPYPVVAGNRDAAFAMAGVDGELCGNGAYPDPVVTARRLAAQAAQRLKQAAPQIRQNLQDAAQQAGNALRNLFNR